jgi:NitT/TauT family transport system permease protein
MPGSYTPTVTVEQPRTEQARAPRPARRVTFAGLKYPLMSLALAVVLVALAEVAADNGWVSRLVLPAPSKVWGALVQGLVTGGAYWPHVVSTVWVTVAGFALAGVIAIVLAGILTALPPVQRVLFPFIVAFQTLPKVAIAPIVVLWLGFGQVSKLFIVMFVSFFPILINTLEGLAVRNRDHLELFQSLGAGRWQLFWHLRLPGSVPFVFAGLRIGLIFSLIGAVVAEFVGAKSGLGYLLLQQKSTFNVPGVFAVLVLLIGIGLSLNLVTELARSRVATWAKGLPTREAAP